MGIYGDTGGYRGLQGATGGYKGLQGVTRDYSPYFTALLYIKNLETKRSYKRTVTLKILKFSKKFIEWFIKLLFFYFLFLFFFFNYSLIC